MSDKFDLYPTEINLHQKSRILKIVFSDNSTFEYPCEFLRVFSTATEEKRADHLVIGKEAVNIDAIEAQGTYAIKIAFDDGHDTAIYSWQTLHDLGENKDQYWQQYLTQLEHAGVTRREKTDLPKKLSILYFNYLANHLRKQSEKISVPPSVETVEQFLTFLARRYRERGYLLDAETVRVTINKQFAELFTVLEDGDEIGIVPNSPNPPSPPKSS